MKILAAVARSVEGPFSLETIDLEAPRDDEVLVEIAGVGLCHTDMTAKRGQIFPIALPAVFGHEGSGIVRAVGPRVRRFVIGDRVVMSFRSCGHCRHCMAEHPAYCESMPPLNYIGTRVDGTSALHGQQAAQKPNEVISSNFFGQSSFATHALTYERNLVRVPDGVDLQTVGPLGCGIQTGAGTILNVLHPVAGSSLLITGGGSVGLSALMAAVAVDCSPIIVAEPFSKRRDLAMALGATHTIDPTAVNLAEAVREIIPAGVDHYFDSTGAPSVISAGLQAQGLRGSAALVGVPPDLDSAISVHLMSLLGLGRSIHGVVEGDSNPETLIPRLMQLHLKGRFPFERLLSKYALADINQAISDQKAGICVKAVLIP